MEKPIIIIDSREKRPYNFRINNKLGGVEINKLDFGDYSIKGMENIVSIERKKSVIELCGNLGKNRKRFEHELDGMSKSKFKYIIIEDYWSNVVNKQPFMYYKGKPIYSKMNPNAIFESIISLQIKFGINFIFAGTREMGQRITRSLLIKVFDYYKRGAV